ncbi:MAG: transporter substrate-binding domain-containing protein [Thermodesulfobacteriota bacterium]
MKKRLIHLTPWIFTIAMLVIISNGLASGADLPEIKGKGILRHLGVPYANFVTGSGDGLDIELVKLFAQHLGVKYEYVETSWKNLIGDISGKKVKPKGEDIEILGDTPIRGDIAANGITVLPWREKIVNYSIPTFPTQVWLVVRADSSVKPIKPSGNIEKDVAKVKDLLKGHTVLGVANTCLDPSLYNLEKTGAKIKLFDRNLNELAPAIIKGEAEMTLLDVADALIALEKWPGKIKVVGPISPLQDMGCAFAKTSPQLRDAFNRFFKQSMKDGTYLRLVKKYYPLVFDYYPEFFKKM